ncbi:hypothetical protein [Salipiger sp.]|uniref:hypothetical protein n=1 Tax=Salipiger sp. TaxID=2078585 RepID=UPI003A97397E
MSRKFIAAVLAVSLSVTGFAAAPARADNKDTARALAAAATLFIIGSALADNAGRATVRVGSQPQLPRPYTPRDAWRDQRLPRVVGRAPQQPPRARVTLPRSCMLEVRGGSMRYVMGERCLERSGVRLHDLPRSCRTDVMTRQGRARAYVAGCLQNAGFTISGQQNHARRYDEHRGGRDYHDRRR